MIQYFFAAFATVALIAGQFIMPPCTPWKYRVLLSQWPAIYIGAAVLSVEFFPTASTTKVALICAVATTMMIWWLRNAWELRKEVLAARASEAEGKA
ncbi:hypothetical protein ACGLHS_31985 [Variovorax sp. VaC1]|uniref:hypothetical protein n=1 Tax=Variovorax sp. VaC1 TaxID=3373132 RepID=UPI0037481053